MASDPAFKGVVSDIAADGQTLSDCAAPPEVEAKCRRLSCVHPRSASCWAPTTALVQLMKAARETPGVKKVLVASGIRMTWPAAVQVHARLRSITWAGT